MANLPRIDRRCFRKWLEKREPSAVVGKSNLPHACPIACFLAAQGARAPRVTEVLVWSRDHYRTPPLWVALFVSKADCRFSGPVRDITASEALGLLAEIEEVVR
jgi:hypothetical protein